MEATTVSQPETQTQPKKEASSLSKDGKWRSFTRVPHLLQYVSSGTYYARVKIRGKIIRKALETDVFSTAKLRLVDFLKEQAERRDHETIPLFSEAIDLYRVKVQADHSMKHSSKHYRDICLAKIQSSWPEIKGLRLDEISPEACREWAGKLKADIASQYFNNVIDTLRLVFDEGNAQPIRRRFLAAGLLFFLALPLVAQDQFSYTTNNGAITLTGYTGPGGDITIPGTINGLPVTSIGTNSFWNNITLTGVTIPDSVTTIDYGAFTGCSSLTSVEMGNTVATVADRAFSFCTNLISVTLPSTVTNVGTLAFSECFSLTNVAIGTGVARIGDGAFMDCFSLGAIIVDPLNTSFRSLDGVLFNQSRTTLITCPGGKAGSYTIPNSVTNIHEGAFRFCLTLTNIAVPSSVTTIKPDVFSGCSSLKTIVVDALNAVYCSVSGILFTKGQTTPLRCPGGAAGNYTVPNTTTNIAGGAFWGCGGLTSITIPNTVTSVGDGAFMFCSALTNIIIGNSVTNLGDWAFYGCTSLAGVTIPSPVTTIGRGTFYDCTSLARVALPDSLTTIGPWAFYRCTSLTNITIPGSVTSLGGNAFSECTSLTGVYFAGNAPSLDSAMFPGVFAGANGVTIYYLSGTSGWGPTFAGRPTVLWNPQVQTGDSTFGVRTNEFGFTITGSSNLVVVVEACQHVSGAVWSPVATNSLTSGSCYFSDHDYANYPARFYRLRSP